MRTSPADPAPVRLAVAGDAAGKRLDAVVGALEAVGSRAEAQRLIEAGRVLVDGRVVPKRHLLAEGERVEVRPAPPPPAGIEPEEMPLTVRYEDEHLLVVDKPAGVVVHPSAGHRGGTLVHGLVAREIAGGGDPARPGIVHRLDRDTSGLLVVARSERAHRRLQRLAARPGDRPALPDPRARRRPAGPHHRPDGRARPEACARAWPSAPPTGARRSPTCAGWRTSGRFSLLEARLETGRTHQIRVHLESVGHPVVGDRVYGRRPESLGLERQFLHAARLAFPHPETGEPVEVESPLPDDLRRALALARRARAPRGEAPAR